MYRPDCAASAVAVTAAVAPVAAIPAPVRLARAELHASVTDPLLGAMSFLNEIMDRYPQAISFAPGAPYAGFFDEVDVAGALARYERHLAQDLGLNPQQIRKRLYQYGPSRGQINGLLAEALRQDEDIQVAPESLVVTVGCQEAMLLALRALCATANDVLAIVNPCFVGIAGAARLLDVATVAVDETEDGIDWDGLLAACRHARAQGKRVRALYVAPDFSNPSGAILDLASRHRLLALAAQEDFLLLEDNAYAFTALPGGALPSLKALDLGKRVVYLGTCAKICMPGVRIGYVVADQPVVDVDGGVRLLADELAAIKSMVTVNTSPICQAIFAGMLLEHGGSLARMSRHKGALYQRNLGLLLAALERHAGDLAGAGGVRWNVPAGGFFVRVQLPVPADAALLEVCAGEYGVLWTPMRHFFLHGGGQRQLRLSCSYLTPEQIDEGARRLGRFLRDPRVQAGARQGAAGARRAA